ncbi:MAG: DUF3052 domain-containing protein [Acidobacteriota bacterium]
MPAGYSGTPLIKKLGIREDSTVLFVNPPEEYAQTLGDLPESACVAGPKDSEIDFVQFFSYSSAEVKARLPELKKRIAPNGMIWVSWPKKASKVPTDLDGNVVRHIALSNGLVDVKVCAVDEIWSGLKLVIPVKDRRK